MDVDIDLNETFEFQILAILGVTQWVTPKSKLQVQIIFVLLHHYYRYFFCPFTVVNIGNWIKPCMDCICFLEVLEVFRNAERPPTAVLFDPQIMRPRVAKLMFGWTSPPK